MDHREWDYGARMPRDSRAPEPYTTQNGPESPEMPLNVADTGSLRPIPEAVEWAERADAWAQGAAQRAEPESGGEVVRSRWSEVAAPGRTAFPEDGIGWRTETAEWRATEQTARWRQTTEWRSASGTHGWRSTTEAWHTGAGAEQQFTASQVDQPGQPLAISGTAYNPGDGTAYAPGDDGGATYDDVPAWQRPAPEDNGGGSWQRYAEGPYQPDSRPAWQQFAAPTSAPWATGNGAVGNGAVGNGAAGNGAAGNGAAGNGGQPPWQPPTPRAARPDTQRADSQRSDTQPSWQQLVDPAAGRYIDGESTRPVDEGRHLVREDDRARWRSETETGRVGRRRAAEAGTGWSAGNGADNWAGHTDTGSMPAVTDWSTRSEAPSWRTEPESERAPERGSGESQGQGGRRRWAEDAGTERPSWAQSSAIPSSGPIVNGWSPGGTQIPGGPLTDEPGTPSWRTEPSSTWQTSGSGAGPNGAVPAWRADDGIPAWRTDAPPPRDDTPSWRREEAQDQRDDTDRRGDFGRRGDLDRRSDLDRRDAPDGGAGNRWRTSGGPAAIGWSGSEPEQEPGWRTAQRPESDWRTSAAASASETDWRTSERRDRPAWAQGAGPAAIGWSGSEPDPAPGDTGVGGRRRAPDPWRRDQPDQRQPAAWQQDEQRSEPAWRRDEQRSEPAWRRDEQRSEPAWRQDEQRDEPAWRRDSQDDAPRRRRDTRDRPGWQRDEDGYREPGAETTRRRREAEPADPWAQNSADTGVIPMTWQPPEADTGSWRPSGSGAVGRARPTNPNRRRDEGPGPSETGTRMGPAETGTRMGPADTSTRMRPGDTGTRMGPADTGTRMRPDDTGTRIGRRRAAAGPRGDAPLDPEVYRREPGIRDDGANWPPDESRNADWRRELGPAVGDAVTEIRPRVDPVAWEPDESAPGSATYREGTTNDWRRELAAESSNLAEGESRRFGTQDFVPFKPVTGKVEAPANGTEVNGTNGSAVNGSPVNGKPVNGHTLNAAASAPAPAAVRSAPAARSAPEVRERWEDAADNVWPPRQSTGYQSPGYQSPGGSYERRAVTGSLTAPAGRSGNLLEPDEDELDEEDTGGPLAAVGYTVIWYGVPVVLFVLYMLVLNGTQQAHALGTLAGAAPQFGLSLLLSMAVAVGLRKASGSWKAASVGLAAAVMGGGLATVLSSAITGNSLS